MRNSLFSNYLNYYLFFTLQAFILLRDVLGNSVEMHAADLLENGVETSTVVNLEGRDITLDVIEYDGVLVFNGDMLVHESADISNLNLLKERHDGSDHITETSSSGKSGLGDLTSVQNTNGAAQLDSFSNGAAADIVTSSDGTSSQAAGDLTSTLHDTSSSSNNNNMGTASIQLLASEVRGSHYWGCEIPWEIDDAEDEDAIEEAIEHWEDHTPFRFKKRSDEDDYLVFVDSDGCSSFIGKQGGRQQIFIGDSCSVGNIIHEIGHAVGLFHEHQRIDRDEYIRVNWDNIEDDRFHKNFEKNSAQESNDVGKYDLASIMHYPTDAFADGNDKTIAVLVTVPNGIDIGQRDELSLRDIDGSIFRFFPSCDEDTETVDVRLGVGGSGTIDELRIEFRDHEFTYPVGFNFEKETEYHEDIVVVEELDDDLDWVMVIKEEGGTDAVKIDYLKVRYNGREYTSGPKDLGVCLDSDDSSCPDHTNEERIDMYRTDERISINIEMGESGTKDDVFLKFNSQGPLYMLDKELKQRQDDDFDFEIVEIDDLEEIEIIKPLGTDALKIISVTVEYDGDVYESGDIDICLDSDESQCPDINEAEVVRLQIHESPSTPTPPSPPTPPSTSDRSGGGTGSEFEVNLSIGKSATKDKIEISLGSQSTRYSLGDEFPRDTEISKTFSLEESIGTLDEVMIFKDGQDSVYITNVKVIYDGDTYDSGILDLCMDSDKSTCLEVITETQVPLGVVRDEIPARITIDIGDSGTDDQVWIHFNTDIRRYDCGQDFPAFQSVEFQIMVPSSLTNVQTATLKKEGTDAVKIHRIKIEIGSRTYTSGDVEVCMDGDDSSCDTANEAETFHMTTDDLHYGGDFQIPNIRSDTTTSEP